MCTCYSVIPRQQYKALAQVCGGLIQVCQAQQEEVQTLQGYLGLAPFSHGDDSSHRFTFSCSEICALTCGAVLPLSSLPEPGGAECMMTLSSARMVLVLPVPGGPCSAMEFKWTCLKHRHVRRQVTSVRTCRLIRRLDSCRGKHMAGSSHDHCTPKAD